MKRRSFRTQLTQPDAKKHNDCNIYVREYRFYTRQNKTYILQYICYTSYYQTQRLDLIPVNSQELSLKSTSKIDVLEKKSSKMEFFWSNFILRKKVRFLVGFKMNSDCLNSVQNNLCYSSGNPEELVELLSASENAEFTFYCGFIYTGTYHSTIYVGNKTLHSSYLYHTFGLRKVPMETQVFYSQNQKIARERKVPQEVLSNEGYSQQNKYIYSRTHTCQEVTL